MLETSLRTIMIPLTNGKCAVVDEVDADLALYRWCYLSKPDSKDVPLQVCRTHRSSQGTGTRYLHRVIMQRVVGRELSRSEIVDHKDGNPLNNSRSNLRVATRAQNSQNSRRYKNNSTGLKGVYFDARYSKWYAKIQVNKQSKFLGYYSTPEDAHEAYMSAAIQYHGEFARFE
jgi:hypothetical protein